PSGGCAVSPFYRELPEMNAERLTAMGYSVVFEDNFDEYPDEEVWNLVSGERHAGYNHPDQISVQDGLLTLTGQSREDGPYGPCWYSEWITLKKKYCRGYFESSIRCSEIKEGSSTSFWSAFWIEGPNPYNGELSQGGIGPGGTEIDIMECWDTDRYSTDFWVSGVEGVSGLSCERTDVSNLGNNYSEEFHTFALLWEEDYYWAFLDGQLVARNAHAYGTSNVEEEVILSLETPNDFFYQPDEVRRMTVDFIRIWQKPAAAD
ncbi:MAG: family 16 glycosylhydrolase, partial [Candidatus Methanomethylophilaceae archaeon]|nr:family 16 glycosylhydrolase [Candidatus Methanomethylophilaceae archaeon]